MDDLDNLPNLHEVIVADFRRALDRLKEMEAENKALRAVKP